MYLPYQSLYHLSFSTVFNRKGHSHIAILVTLCRSLHCWYIEPRNREKSLTFIWQRFSCLLDEWIAKISKKNFFHGGFSRTLRSPRPKFQNHLVFITFHNRIFVILSFEVVWPRRPRRPRKATVKKYFFWYFCNPFIK